MLLNGWWDFLPILHSDLRERLERVEVPNEGWVDAAYLVPGFFTDHPYPEAWRASRSGWARRRFNLGPLERGARVMLHLRAAIPKAHVFLNGRAAFVQEDMFLGEPVDVTDSVHEGENELAIFLTEFRTYAHPQTGSVSLIDVPWGCCIASEQAGIWQDVSLEWRHEVHVADVTVRTSVRDGLLDVATQVLNVGQTAFEGTLAGTVEEVGNALLRLPPVHVSLGPGQSTRIAQTVDWRDYHPWSPEDPHLYHLHTELSDARGVVDAIRTRFGFREVWIERHRILLNGRPQRWRGEWCHKSHSHWLRPEYVRQWFGQLQDLNMNYVRMHTFPHPSYFLDIADEMGIFICEESALHGSGQSGLDTPLLWERAREHVRRMVRRDKNHPSLVLWSVENEMRWSLNIVPSAKDELPKLRALFGELDPTRPAYHEGDSALWNEDEQALISRHYGPACHGLGWWDKTVPLHAGEMGRWHYASPHVALQWADDEVFADYGLLSRSLAMDAERIIELGRANEVSCLFVWNTSGLDNLRPSEERNFTWEEPNSPFPKPLAHRPYESEYAWWDEGKGYRPGFSFGLLRHAFRPLAVVVLEERTQFFLDRPVPHTVFVVNDLPTAVEGELDVRLEQGGQVVWAESRTLSVASGCTGRAAFRVALGGACPGRADLVSTFRCAQGEDVVWRTLGLASPEAREEALELPTVGVYGPSAVAPWLAQHGVRVMQLGEDEPLDPARTPIVIFGERTVTPGGTQNRRLRDFLCGGGRALVLEQSHSLFPGLDLARQPTEMAHPRDASHPVLAGIAPEDLRFFGDDPFGLPSSDSWVTVYPYAKPAGHELVRPIVDSSGGDFATGGLTWAPVVEAHIDAGVVLATQLRLTDRLSELPVANRLLCNALRYLAYAEPLQACSLGVDAHVKAGLAESLSSLGPDALLPPAAGNAPVTIVSGAASSSLDVGAWRAYLAMGNTVVVWGLAEPARGYWEGVVGRKIECFVPGHPVYHLVRARPSLLLAGLSNEDTCWLDNYTYRTTQQKDTIVDYLLSIDGAAVHLTNAPRSGLDVLYGDDQATEWKRMPALSALLDAELPRTGAALVEVPVGTGRVIFCQVCWRTDLWRFRRFLGLLLWNLGVRTATDIVAGGCTPTTGHVSEGYPTSVRVARGLGGRTLEELLALSKRRVEYCSDNVAFGTWPGWQIVQTPRGRLRVADLPGEQEIALGVEVRSPEPRKLMQTVGGLPSPDLQTTLRLQGQGRVRTWVNGRPLGAYELAWDAATYVPDIDLEAGANLLVLVWEPGTTDADLELRFENREHKPEGTFAFA
jgi:hypothetical protein